jgi:hypothetical protein
MSPQTSGMTGIHAAPTLSLSQCHIPLQSTVAEITYSQSKLSRGYYCLQYCEQHGGVGGVQYEGKRNSWRGMRRRGVDNSFPWPL